MAEVDELRLVPAVKMVDLPRGARMVGVAADTVPFADAVPFVEDEFGFTIPHADIAKLGSLDDLHKYVLARRFRGYQEDCLSGIVFYKLSRAMSAAQGVSRKAIGESTRLAELVPRHRRRVWRALRREAGLRLPELRRPVWVARVATWVTIVLGAATPVMLSLGLLNGAIIVALLAMFIWGHFFAWVTRPLAFDFHADCTTMGQLVSLTLALNYQTVAAELDASISDTEVLRRLRSIGLAPAPVPAFPPAVVPAATAELDVLLAPVSSG